MVQRPGWGCAHRALRTAAMLAAAALGLCGPSLARATTGGPDAYGYTWADSLEPSVTYAWQAPGSTAVDLTQTGDDFNLGFQPLSFPFPYYGTDFSAVAICSNGWISLVDDVSHAFRNGALPDAANEPRGAIAAWWDDLYCTTNRSRILFEDLGTRAVVTWENVHDYSDSTRKDVFQVILRPDGEIKVQIQSILSSPTSSTLGIESPLDDDGLTVFANAPAGAPTSDYAVVFRPPVGIPNGLDCANPLPLACGAAVAGDLAGGRAAQSDYSCGAHAYDGAEDLYRIDFAVATSARFQLVMASGDADLLLLSACDPNQCLAASADELAVVGLTGTWYVVVDCVAGQEGPYELRAECVDCVAAATMDCGEVVSGDLAFGNAGRDSYGCASGLDGRELGYRIDSIEAQDLQIEFRDLSGEPQLLLLDGCDPSACSTVAPGVSVIPGFVGTRYLVVDCAAGGEGAFTLGLQCLGDDFAFCGGAATFHGDPWDLDNGAWMVDGWIYPVNDTGTYALRVDGTTTYSQDGANCPPFPSTESSAIRPNGPASVTWSAPEGVVHLDLLEAQSDTCCGLLVSIGVTNTDVVPHSYEFRAYQDLAFGLGTGTCSPTRDVDAGPVGVAGTQYADEQDLLALGAGSCSRQPLFYSAEDWTTPRASYEMLPPNLPTVMEFVKWDDGARPCTAWSGFVNAEVISICASDASFLLSWRFPQGSGTLLPGESDTASYRIGRGCEWPCDVPCEDPVLPGGRAYDVRRCSTGVQLEWEEATFPGAGHGTYHVHRSTTSFADALASPPLTPAAGVRRTSFADVTTRADETYWYVVRAESTDMPGCGPGPLVHGSVSDLQLGPVLDEGALSGPAGVVGSTLRLTPVADDSVALHWPTAPPPSGTEQYVVLRSDDDPGGTFTVRAQTSATDWTDPEAFPRFDPRHVWFYDVRFIDDCGAFSTD